jgi:hypothetical protein
MLKTFTSKGYDEIPITRAMLELVADPANKAVMMGVPYILSCSFLDYRSGVSSLKIVRKPIRTNLGGFNFKEFSFLYEAFNEKTMWLFEAGITNYLLNSEEGLEGRGETNFKEEDIGPQVLTMEHLELAFYICLAPLALCLVVFIGEVFVFWISGGYEKRRKVKRVNERKMPKRKETHDAEETVRKDAVRMHQIEL